MFACFSPFKREAVKQDIHVILKRIKMFYINWLFFFFFGDLDDYLTPGFHNLTTKSCISSSTYMGFYSVHLKIMCSYSVFFFSILLVKLSLP